MKSVVNNEDTFKETLNRNSDLVYRLAFSQTKSQHDADDIYQEVFYRYLKRKPVFESEEHEKAWFIRVTLNCTKTEFKSFWKTRVFELSSVYESFLDETEFDETTVNQVYLQSALKKIPKKYRAVLHLFYYEEIETKDIAKILQISDSNVRMILSRARKMLKEILEREA